MCIVLATTAHPDFAIIVLDNRDEFIRRPTSRPHWWSAPGSSQKILSSRDLHRAEQGTWLGITRAGHFAVLTNFKEDNVEDVNHPVQGLRSRGAMVTAWLTAPEEEGTEDFVHRLLAGDGVKGVGGFSLVCGKLRRNRVKEGQEQHQHQLSPFAVISNRAGTADDVPWIAGERDEVYGLSNTSYDDPVAWPKVELGKQLVLQAISDSVKHGSSHNDLVESLFSVLDTDTLPAQNGESFQEFTFKLRQSIFIPAIGAASGAAEVPPQKADEIAAANAQTNGHSSSSERVCTEKVASTPSDGSGCVDGVYGTQRQTVLLVDWEGNVTIRERSLWDERGRPVLRGEGDMEFKFSIEGWAEYERMQGVGMQSHI